MGARTERIGSKPHFAGLQVSGAPVTLVEGGEVATLVLTATVPVLCSPQVEQNSFGNILNVDHLFSGPGAGIVLRSPSSCPWRGRAGTALPLGWTSAQGQNVLSSDQKCLGPPCFKIPDGVL